MAVNDTKDPRPREIPVFQVACWLIALMAFGQLLTAGLALASRFEKSQKVQIIEKEVPKLVTVRVPADPILATQAPVSARPPLTAAPPEMPTPSPAPIALPRVDDPRAERFVNEARAARVAGDMGAAIVKLQEALAISPDEPTLHYELGMVHEQMGVFDTAAHHYEKVFLMGIQGAGALYEMAAKKLRDGFEQPGDALGKISLARVRVFNDPAHPTGEQVVLSIPLQKAPTAEIDFQEIEVVVFFFNRTPQGKISQLEDNSRVTEQWATLPFDWAGGEETLRMEYIVAPQDATAAHLFGKQTYYGQVVLLMYQGEVLDVQAWPRDLAARVPGLMTKPESFESPEFFDPEFLPPDFDPTLPLLPTK